MASFTTPIPPTPADWTVSGACISGSTARLRDATRAAPGCGITIITRSHERVGSPNSANRKPETTTDGFRPVFAKGLSDRVSAVLHRKCSADHPALRVHVGHGRDAHAGRLGDVEDVDADARRDVDSRGGVVPRHVDRNDGGDDAAIPGRNAVALSTGPRRDGRVPRPL